MRSRPASASPICTSRNTIGLSARDLGVGTGDIEHWENSRKTMKWITSKLN